MKMFSICRNSEWIWNYRNFWNLCKQYGGTCCSYIFNFMSCLLSEIKLVDVPELGVEKFVLINYVVLFNR